MIERFGYAYKLNSEKKAVHFDRFGDEYKPDSETKTLRYLILQ